MLTRSVIASQNHCRKATHTRAPGRWPLFRHSFEIDMNLRLCHDTCPCMVTAGAGATRQRQVGFSSRPHCKNIRISTDISWRVFHNYLNATCSVYAFVSVNRRNNEARTRDLRIETYTELVPTKQWKTRHIRRYTDIVCSAYRSARSGFRVELNRDAVMGRGQAQFTLGYA